MGESGATRIAWVLTAARLPDGHGVSEQSVRRHLRRGHLPSITSPSRSTYEVSEPPTIAAPQARLHDRLQYRKQADGVWVRERLAP